MFYFNHFILICNYLLPCDIYNLSLVNKKLYRWVLKFRRILITTQNKLLYPYISYLHNCSLINDNEDRVYNGCIKFKNVKNSTELFIEAAGIVGLKYICEALICFKPDINARNNRAFRYAAKYGNLSICKWLHNSSKFNNVNPNAKDDWAFFQAARHGNLKVCKWLLQFNPEIHAKYIFVRSAKKGRFDMIHWILKLRPHCYKNIDFAFMYAGANGRLKMCKWLLKFAKTHNININLQYADYWAFKSAANKGHLKTCKWLLKFGVPQNVVEKYAPQLV